MPWPNQDIASGRRAGPVIFPDVTAPGFGTPSANGQKDFGADPTGVIDASAIFQRAVTANEASGGGPIIVPPGTYQIGTALTGIVKTVFMVYAATFTGAGASSVGPAIVHDNAGNLVAKSLTVLATGPYAPSAAALAGGMAFGTKLVWAPPPNGTDDTTALAGLIAGGNVWLILQRGTYLLSNSLNVELNTTIEGCGIDATTLKIITGDINNFASGYMIQYKSPQGTNISCNIRDLTLDGNRRGGGGSAGNGSLLLPDSYWNIERIRFFDSNAFKLYLSTTTAARVKNCRWDNTGSGNDNIGGGGNSDCVIEGCYFDPTIVGNVFDHVGGSGIIYRNNYSHSTNNMYLEGVTDSIIESNVFYGGLNLQSNSGYTPTTNTNPRNIVVRANQFITCPGNAIQVRYDDYSAATTHVPGGGNIIEGNEIDTPNKIGILVYPGSPGAAIYANYWKTQPDVIRGNTIRNCNADGSNVFNWGTGAIDNAGIVDVLGWGDVINGNVVVDDRAGSAKMQYGIALGGNGGTAWYLCNVTATGNSCVGHLIAPFRFAAGYVPGGSRLHDNIGYNPVGNVSMPALAATTVNLPNPKNHDCQLYLEIGTLTAIAIGGLAPPVNGTFQDNSTGGTLLHSTQYFYRVTALNASGETLGSTETSITTGAGADTRSVVVTWAHVAGATGYNVYGRTTGAETKITASINTQGLQYIDTGSALSGALPGGDTTGSTAIAGITAAAPAGTVHSIRWPVGQGLKITYTVAPTGTLFGD